MTPPPPDTHDPTVITGMGLACPWGIDQAASVLTALPKQQPTPDNHGVYLLNIPF